MSDVKFTQVKLRLTRLIRAPGGLTVENALKDARMNLEAMREECVDDIDAKLALIHEKYDHAELRPTPEAFDDFYRMSNDIVATAGLFGMGELGEAAFSLCEIIDRLKTLEQWDWPAVELHLSALRVLRHAKSGDPANAKMLAGLRKLTARVHPHYLQ